MEAVVAASAFAAKYATAIQLASTAVAAYGAYQTGQMQAQSMRLQASQAELQGRQNALNYSRQGLQVLRRQEQLAAAVRARAASGGVDPFTGSPLSIQQIDMMRAQEEAEIARENAQMAIYGGLAQSQSLQSAASTAEFMGTVGAVSRGISGFAAAGDVRTPTETPA
jgi:hypothetical protein